jgi:hypothetical protein
VLTPKWVFRVVKQLSFHYQYDCGSPTRAARLEGRAKVGPVEDTDPRRASIVPGNVRHRRRGMNIASTYCTAPAIASAERSCRPTLRRTDSVASRAWTYRFGMSFLDFSSYLAALLF